MSYNPRALRELAADLFASGHGYESVANRLGIPAGAVGKWQQTYRAVGRGGLLNMGKMNLNLNLPRIR